MSPSLPYTAEQFRQTADGWDASAVAAQRQASGNVTANVNACRLNAAACRMAAEVVEWRARLANVKPGNEVIEARYMLDRILAAGAESEASPVELSQESVERLFTVLTDLRDAESDTISRRHVDDVRHALIRDLERSRGGSTP